MKLFLCPKRQCLWDPENFKFSWQRKIYDKKKALSIKKTKRKALKEEFKGK